MYPDQLVLQLSSEVLQLLFLFEMGEQVIAQEEDGLATWHWVSKLGQVMQLPEHPGEPSSSLPGSGQR